MSCQNRWTGDEEGCCDRLPACHALLTHLPIWCRNVAKIGDFIVAVFVRKRFYSDAVGRRSQDLPRQEVSLPFGPHSLPLVSWYSPLLCNLLGTICSKVGLPAVVHQLALHLSPRFGMCLSSTWLPPSWAPPTPWCSLHLAFLTYMLPHLWPQPRKDIRKMRPGSACPDFRDRLIS